MAATPVKLRAPGDWLTVRDRLLASPRFQRWAVAFPPTRWIAKRRARALFDLCAGFVYSQVLYACVSLRLFDQLADGPQSLTVLARRLFLSEDAALRLLEAACSLELVARQRTGVYRLGSLGAALRGNPGVAAMIEHHGLLYADLANPVALLRGESTSRQLAAYWPYADYQQAAQLTGAETSPYTALMAQSQAMIAAEVLDAYPIGRHRSLLDVGGGDGTFLVEAAKRAPRLQVTLFDLPSVAEGARLRFARSGLTGRASAVGGDFRSDSLPTGADAASLVRVIHDHDDATAMTILRAIHQALPRGGTVLLAEPMAETTGAEPIGHAYFGFYLLAMGRGRPRSAADLKALLAAAGFSDIRAVKTRLPMLTRILVARRS